MANADVFEYNADEMIGIFRDAAHILRYGAKRTEYTWIFVPDFYSDRTISRRETVRSVVSCAPRLWHKSLQDRFQLHKAVYEAMGLARPHDWQQLLLEWPHVSETDYNRLAYTRDEAAGIADRQTITTIGKYLTRHFNLPDHAIRDIVHKYTLGDEKFEIVDAVDEFIRTVQDGPRSCMVIERCCWPRCEDGERRHPYAVYDPQYGWRMARRVGTDGQINGRALLMCGGISGEDAKYFVRSYARNDGGYSHTDEKLEAWLKTQGYVKHQQWNNGEELARYAAGGEYLCPYLDGGIQRVEVHRDVLTIDEDGSYDATNTSGLCGEDGHECADCGDRYSEDDMCTVGRYDDHYICVHCREENYSYARTRGGRSRYIHNDNVVYVEAMDDSYDVDYLDDNGIIETVDGEYDHVDSCVEVNGDWYNEDDARIVHDADGDYQLRDECVECSDGEWRLENNCEQLDDGSWVPADHAVTCLDGTKQHRDDCVRVTGWMLESDVDDDANEYASATPTPAPLPTERDTIAAMQRRIEQWADNTVATSSVVINTGITTTERYRITADGNITTTATE